MRGTRSAPSSSWKTLVNKNYLYVLLLALLMCAQAKLAFAFSPRAGVSRPVLSVNNDDQIRIKLDTIKNNVTVTGQELNFPGSRDDLGYRAIRIHWRDIGGGLSEWQIEDRDSAEKLLVGYRAKALTVAGRGLRVGLKPLPGTLTLLPVKSGEANIVTSIDIETYVRGVLPAEMPQTWPIEALKAQAIAARTFALYKRKERRRQKATYDVESGVMDQVYMVSVFEEGADKTLAIVEQAVRETRGIVLTTASAFPQLLAAYYHSDCGGRTEDARIIWGDKSSAGTATDSGCPLNPHAHWRYSISLSEISQKLANLLSKTPGRELIGISTKSYTSSGRIARLRLAWNDGSESLMAAHDFRMAVGHDQIKSTNFKLLQVSTQGADTEIEFVGQGFGHGVGMCQWGAKSMAQTGQSYQSILSHYYPRAYIRTLATLGTSVL